MLFTHGSSKLDYIDIPLGDISFFHSARPVYLPYMMRDQLSGLLMNHHVGDACTKSMIAEIWVIETTMSAHYHRSSLLNGKNKVDMTLHITFTWFSHQCNTRYTVNKWCHKLIGLLITLSCLPVMDISQRASLIRTMACYCLLLLHNAKSPHWTSVYTLKIYYCQ